jgi:omega-6 fatty acid desaturase (delta-12 desaturase)
MELRTGKALILATKPYAKEVRWQSWYYTLSTLLILISLFFGTILIPFLALRIVCSLLTGLVLVRMFVIYHDYLHHSILTKSKIARTLFKGFGLFVLVPPSIWKRTHDYHHNNNSKLFSASVGSFPILTKEKFVSCSKKEQRQYLAVRHPVTIALGYFSVFFFGMSVQSFLSSPRRHYDSIISIVTHVALSILVFWFFGWETWLLAILIPFMLSSALGAYLFYAQHNFPGVTFKGDIEWSYDHAALESSSYMVMNRFWRWVTANIGYHHIHHINSRIPFYRLPEAMKNIPELRLAKTTTLNPSDIIACFRMKVWDAEKNEMTSV